MVSYERTAPGRHAIAAAWPPPLRGLLFVPQICGAVPRYRPGELALVRPSRLARFFSSGAGRDFRSGMLLSPPRPFVVASASGEARHALFFERLAMFAPSGRCVVIFDLRVIPLCGLADVQREYASPSMHP